MSLWAFISRSKLTDDVKINDVNRTCCFCEWHVDLNLCFVIFEYKSFFFLSTFSFFFILSSSIYLLLLTFIFLLFLFLFSSSSAWIWFIFVFIFCFQTFDSFFVFVFFVFKRSILFSLILCSWNSTLNHFILFFSLFFLSRNSIYRIFHSFVLFSLHFNFVIIKMSQDSIVIEQNSFCQTCFKFFIKDSTFIREKKVKNKLCVYCARLRYNYIKMNWNWIKTRSCCSRNWQIKYWRTVLSKCASLFVSFTILISTTFWFLSTFVTLLSTLIALLTRSLRKKQEKRQIKKTKILFLVLSWTIRTIMTTMTTITTTMISFFVFDWLVSMNKWQQFTSRTLLWTIVWLLLWKMSMSWSESSC